MVHSDNETVARFIQSNEQMETSPCLAKCVNYKQTAAGGVSFKVSRVIEANYGDASV